MIIKEVGDMRGQVHSMARRLAAVAFVFILPFTALAREPSADVEKLLGTHKFALQWISWDTFGTATVTRKDGGLYIDASQELGGDYVTLRGKLAVVEPGTFVVTGGLVTRVHHLNGGQACPREGTFTFKAKGKRKYWRLQEMDNPCAGGGVVDYVDVFF